MRAQCVAALNGSRNYAGMENLRALCLLEFNGANSFYLSAIYCYENCAREMLN